MPELLNQADATNIIHNRIICFAEALELPSQRILNWCFVQEVLSWVWAIEHGCDSSYFEQITEGFDGVDKMIIQLATQQDLEFLNDIMQCSKAYWGYDADFMKTFMKNFGLTSDYIDQKNTFIASSDKGSIGFYSFSVTSDNQLELDNFFLHPNYIGKCLVSETYGVDRDRVNLQKQEELDLW